MLPEDCSSNLTYPVRNVRGPDHRAFINDSDANFARLLMGINGLEPPPAKMSPICRTGVTLGTSNAKIMSSVSYSWARNRLGVHPAPLGR